MTSNKVSTVHHIPNSNIVIDYWNLEPTKSRFIRFMTLIRMGSKHLDLIRHSNYTFYTSDVNKWILQTCFEIPDSRIIAVAPNESFEVFDSFANENIEVTLFDANYCVGSCMFLFQGSFGNVLWTGYFRPSADWGVLEVPVLRSLIGNKNLNVVYIDNSYAAEHCEFPKRAEIVKDVVSLIGAHPNHKVIIAGKPLGKEEVLVDIAETFNIQIGVPVEKYKFLTRVGFAKHFTTDCTASRVSTDENLTNLNLIRERQSREGRCLVILLTAWYKFAKESCVVSAAWDIPGLHILPYSSHCCHSELVEFLSILRPHRIEPIINEKTSPNVVIPKSLHNLCYDPSLGYPLVDSDWDYLTCPDVDSIVPKDLQHDPLSPLTECQNLSTDMDKTLITGVSNCESTSMDLCQSTLKKTSKSFENHAHSADEVFVDSVNRDVSVIVDKINLSVENGSLEPDQMSNSDHEEFKDAIESVNATSPPNTSSKGDDSSVLDQARTENSEVRTSGNERTLECSRTNSPSNEISLEISSSSEGNSPQRVYNVIESGPRNSENALANSSTVAEESSKQGRTDLEEPGHDETENSVTKSSTILDCTDDSCATELPSIEGVQEPEYLPNNAQDSVEVVQASDPIYTPTEANESDVSCDSLTRIASHGQKRELVVDRVSPKRLRKNNDSWSVCVLPDRQATNSKQFETVEQKTLKSSRVGVSSKIRMYHTRRTVNAAKDSPGILESERSLMPTMSEEEITDLHNRLFLIYSMVDPQPEDPRWLTDAWKDPASYEWHNGFPYRL